MAPIGAEIYAYLLRPLSIYLAALAAVRLMGKRALGQLSLFDLVVMVGIGDIVVLVGLERKVPILDGLVMLGILGGLEILMTLLTFRWPWFARLVEGRPTTLVKDGQLLRGNMLREHISLSDLRQEMRKQGFSEPAEAKEVIMEACGKVSVIPREDLSRDLERVLAEVAALRRDLAATRRQTDTKD
jgi:uncharacterized membrane protein YcaP (DUF421 family)